MLQFSRKSFNIDKYALTVCYSWFKQNKHEQEGVFELLYRKKPSQELPCVIASGFHLLQDYFQEFNFNDSDLQYVKEVLNINDKKFIEFLRAFSIDQIEMISFKEGDFVFPKEPILSLKGKIGYLILIEAPTLALLHLSISSATQAFILSSLTDLPISDMGIRRAYGPQAAQITSYFSVLNGFKSTSNVLIGYQHGFDIVGTMSHAYVLSYEAFVEDKKVIEISPQILSKLNLSQEEFQNELLKRREKFQFENAQFSELMSFLNFFQCFNENLIALIDTYNVYKSGFKNFLLIASFLEDLNIKQYGIRLDSGDLIQQSLDLRKMAEEFDEKFNYQIAQKMKIVATNDIGIKFLNELKNTKHSIDVIGIGTQLSTYRQIKPIGIVYKLVELNGIGLLKQTGSIIKATLPFQKQSFQIYCKDQIYRVLCLLDEKIEIGENIFYKLNQENNEFTSVQIFVDEFEILNDQKIISTEIDIMQYQEIQQKNKKILKKNKNFLKEILYGKKLVQKQKEIKNKNAFKQQFNNQMLMYHYISILIHYKLYLIISFQCVQIQMRQL